MRVILSDEAGRDLMRLDHTVASRIISKIHWLAEHFDTQIPQPLGYRFRGLFKLRVGDWRVVYEVDHMAKIVIVHLIDHRSRIYERR